MKTIAEIRAEHSAKAGTIMGRYQDEIGEIRSTKTLPEGAYLDRLTDAQRFGLLREQKQQKAADAHERTLREYGAEVERYQAELAERTNALKGRLFGVADAGALSRAALADEGELSTLLEVATQAGNEDLARAVFVAAHHKGAGDLVARYFDGIDPEARGLYGELTDAPSPELLERQRTTVERVVQMPDPDSLTPSPAFGPY
ncbi:MAG: hypothetical protein M3R38_25855 [Actinomycetota bacterium]|nr:hypothetical protein [Actinomycetota bacterium]MDP9487099.1 hypothetical protein [Actinomycetota bacterium]